MKHVAAVLLLQLAGKEVNEANIKSVIAAAGGSADAERVKSLLGSVNESGVDGLISKGKEKLASATIAVSGGGGGGGAAAAAPAAGGAKAAAPAAAEEEEDGEEYALDF